MKQRTSLLLCLFAVVLFLNSCTKIVGHGPIVAEVRTPAAFSTLKVRMSGQIIFRQSPTLKIELEAQKNIINVIETNVTNDELVLKYKDNVNIRSHEQVRITVSGPSVNSFIIEGSGNISTTGNFQPDNLFVHIKGSGNVFIPSIITNDFDAMINGSGDIRIANGETKTEEVDINGSGSVDLQNIIADHAATNTRGSGSIKVNVTKTLFSKISGSGSVYYKGNPQVQVEVTGSGKVVRL